MPLIRGPFLFAKWVVVAVSVVVWVVVAPIAEILNGLLERVRGAKHG
jgi:hypothetical protein